jgi:hypothetical protein
MSSRSIAEAPEEIRQAVETLREDTEVEATSSGLVPTKTRGTRGRYETTYYMYVRGFCPLISQRRQAKRGRLVTETPVFTWKVVKFGIAQKMNDRDDKYGADDGFFYFCLDFMSKKDADHIEHSLCAILKPFCVDGRREYIKSEELCSFLDVGNPTTPEGYRAVMLRLYTLALRLAHSFYPAMLERPWPYGRSFEPQEVPSVKAQLCGSSNAEGELSPEDAVSLTQMTVKEKGLELDDIPDYGSLFPGFSTPPLPHGSHTSLQMEQERTKQAEAQARQAEAEAQARRAKAEAKQAEREERQRLLALVESGKMTIEQMMAFCGKETAVKVQNDGAPIEVGSSSKVTVDINHRNGKNVKKSSDRPKLGLPEPTTSECKESWVREYIIAYVVTRPMRGTFECIFGWQDIYRSFMRFCLAKKYPIPQEKPAQERFVGCLGQFTKSRRSPAWSGISLNADGQTLAKQNHCRLVEAAVQRARLA